MRSFSKNITKGATIVTSGGGGGGTVDLTGVVKSSGIITQTLNNGNNVINHNLGVFANSIIVKNGLKVINTDNSDIDTNNVNINLSGGGPIVDATILIDYV